MHAQDTRESQRWPAYLGAQIFFDHTPSTFDCLVRNTSDEGALIDIESIWGLPERFRLHIAKFNRSVECKVCWKTHNRLGVQFV